MVIVGKVRIVIVRVVKVGIVRMGIVMTLIVRIANSHSGDSDDS